MANYYQDKKDKLSFAVSRRSAKALILGISAMLNFKRFKLASTIVCQHKSLVRTGYFWNTHNSAWSKTTNFSVKYILYIATNVWVYKSLILSRMRFNSQLSDSDQPMLHRLHWWLILSTHLSDLHEGKVLIEINVSAFILYLIIIA